MIASVHHVDVSVGGIIIGLLVAALVYLLGTWLAGETGQPVFRPIGAILAVLVFVVMAFSFY